MLHLQASTCNLEQFCNQLNDIIETINSNRHEIYIFGDMNINFLKFNEHTQTEEFFDVLYANNILSITTKPTRLITQEHSLTIYRKIAKISPSMYNPLQI